MGMEQMPLQTAAPTSMSVPDAYARDMMQMQQTQPVPVPMPAQAQEVRQSQPPVSDALKAQARRYTAGILMNFLDKCKARRTHPVALCACFPTPRMQPDLGGAQWDRWVKQQSDTEKCARNCVYYQNPKRLQKMALDLIHQLDHS